MARPQAGILPEPSESALFLILRVRDRARNGARAARAAARVPALTTALAKRAPRDRLVSAVSFGSQLWDVVSTGKRPKAFQSFPALEVGGRHAPATGGDLLLHTTARRADLCFELALRLRRELGDAAEVIEEVHGFRYLDVRDARVVIEEDGRELEILRHGFPYGTTSECGLFFIAYIRDLAIPEKMLRRMMGASDNGLHDRLMEFTRAVSGATFFAPSLAGLRSLGMR